MNKKGLKIVHPCWRNSWNVWEM